MATDLKVQEILNKRTRNMFVFTFGATGSGKSSMLTGVFTALKKRYAYDFNVYDEYSSKIFSEYTRNLRLYKRLPRETVAIEALSGIPFQFTDIIIDDDQLKEKIDLTFIEMSGEDLETVFPDFKSITDEFRNGSNARPGEQSGTTETRENVGDGLNQPMRFGNILDQLFSDKSIYVLCLIVISHDNAVVEQELAHRFLSLINRKQYIPRLLGINLVISMWDKGIVGQEDAEEPKNDDSRSKQAKQFAATHVEEVANKLNQLAGRGLPVTFQPFSIGKISEDDELKVDEFDITYSDAIIDWIFSSIGMVNVSDGGFVAGDEHGSNRRGDSNSNSFLGNLLQRFKEWW